MQTLYRVKGYIAHASLDSYANGCELEAKTEFSSEFSIVANSLQALITGLCSHFKANPDDDVLLDCCEEDGRLDIQVHQREAFEIAEPSKATIAAWKEGKLSLYLTDYSFQVERVHSDFSLTDALAEEGHQHVR